MTTAIVFFVLLTLSFAQEDFSDENTLKNLTEEARRKIDQTLTNIDNAPGEYDKMVVERLNCLMWEFTVQKEAVNKSVTDAVFGGMQKNKQFKNFQCISNAARDTFAKLEAIEEKVPENSRAIKEKRLEEVTPFGIVVDKLNPYVQDLCKKKTEELKKAGSADARKKILTEVTQKMKLLETILEQINEQVKNMKFKFFEEYISYLYTTENSLKKIQREGSSKINNCLW